MREWWARMRATLGRRPDDLKEEIEEHLRMSIEEEGETARRRFGNVTAVQERAREQWSFSGFETLLKDIRYAFRTLRGSPGFAAVAVISLALGIGANTVIFSAIDNLMLRKLPVRDPDALAVVRVFMEQPGHPRAELNWMYPDFQRMRELSRAFSGFSATNMVDRSNLVASGPGGGPDPSEVRVVVASGDYFVSTMGVGAAMGRTFTPDEDRAPGAAPVAVISDAYWARRFGRARDVVGRTLTISGTAFTIVGVTPRGFSGEWTGRPADLWVPYTMVQQVLPEVPPGLQNHPARIVARRRAGVSPVQAQASTQAAFEHMQSQSGARPQARVWLEVQPAATGYSPQRESFAQPLAILMAMAGLVLLIACVNVANLLLARSAARGREISVRLAIGAGASRIVRQLLTESLVLAAISGILGAAFAIFGRRILEAYLALGALRSSGTSAPAQLPVSLDLKPDPRVFGFCAAICLLIGIGFGLAPALRAARVSIVAALRGAKTQPGRGTAGRVLVILQVAVSVMLLVGAGLLARTLHNLRTQNLGLDRDHVLLVQTNSFASKRGPAELRNLWQIVQQRVSALPGVISASAANGGVLSGFEPVNVSNPLRIEGETTVPNGLPGYRTFLAPGFFRTMGIRMVAGREFTEADTDAAPRVVVLNESLARHYFGDRNPIGLHIQFRNDPAQGTEIIGVVKDFAKGTPRDLQRKLALTYFSYRDRESSRNIAVMHVAVRVAGAPLAMAARVREELRAIDPELPILKIYTVDQQLEEVLVKDRMLAGLALALGVLVVALACLGLYGVIAYTVARRTSEIGTRLALGATRGAVLGMVLREGVATVLAGIAIGIPAAFAAARLIAARLYGIGAHDPLTLARAALLLLCVAALAGFVPARRASRIDPMVALRYE
jgi:predicted permease